MMCASMEFFTNLNVVQLPKYEHMAKQFQVRNSSAVHKGKVVVRKSMDIQKEVVGFIKKLKTFPKAVVVDLDYTVWPTYCEFYGPADNPPKMYSESLDVLKGLDQSGVLVAVASRTPTPATAKAFVKKLGIHEIASSQQIYPGRKIQHLTRISQQIGVEFKDMIFFDDEQRNIVDVESIGVQAELVNHGFNLSALKSGFQRYEQKWQSISTNSRQQI
eukprot:TRINITY_DN2658_c0_g1_i3.p1 TRINITY_DN2658_c0_g1~~TRINITY_DN2658_c0_g1_i3.p1  ORF type:complete len:217 (-),score=27.98 TRINITY_DN2658_c0_g1_i3:325-975(-)